MDHGRPHLLHGWRGDSYPAEDRVRVRLHPRRSARAALAQQYLVAGSAMKSARLRPARYILVGATCAALYNAVMILGEWAGLGYVTSSILSLVVVIPTGYLLHAGFTFGRDRSWSAFFRFAGSILAGFPI